METPLLKEKKDILDSSDALSDQVSGLDIVEENLGGDLLGTLYVDPAEEI